MLCIAAVSKKTASEEDAPQAKSKSPKKKKKTKKKTSTSIETVHTTTENHLAISASNSTNSGIPPTVAENNLQVSSKGNTTLQCSTCGKKYKRVKCFIKHKLSHSTNTSKKRYSCSTCGKDFPFPGTLAVHKWSKHRILYQHYKCVKCNAKFQLSTTWCH